MRVILRGRRNICWGWRLMPVPPRIVNNVSCVTRIHDASDFAWQAQHLVMLEDEICCSAHCKWRVMCDGHQSWESFCVAGAVFGDLGVSVFVAGAIFGEIWIDSRSAKCCNFQYKLRLRSAKSNLGERAGARWRVHGRIMVESAAHWNWRFNRSRRISLRFWSALLRGRRSIWWGWRVMLVVPRIINDVPYVTKIKHGRGRCSIWWGWRVMLVVPRIVNNIPYETKIKHESLFAWQAQYLGRLAGNACCSARCNWRSISNEDQPWELFLRGRCSIWWGWRVMPVFSCIVNNVAYETIIKRESFFSVAGVIFGQVEVLYVTRVNYACYFSWQVKYLVILECFVPWQT